MIKLVLLEVEAADQGAQGARLGNQGHEGAFHLGQLRDFPGVLGRLDHPDHGTGTDLDVGRCLGVQARFGRLEAFARDLDLLAVGTGRQDLARVGIQHHGGEHVSVVGVVGQGVVNGVFTVLGVGGQGHELLGAAVLLAALVVHDAAAQRGVGGFLFAGIDGGVDVQAARVGLVAVLGKDQLARHFGHVLGMHPGVEGACADLQRLGLGFSGLGRRDEAVFLHALDDVELARAGALGVADRVVGRGRLGQAGQHGRFGDGDVLQWLAEIGFTGGGKAIGPISQINLVHVDLENLVFAQQML